MGVDFNFNCDSLTETLKSSSESYLYCILCKSLEESIRRDLNLFKSMSFGFSNKLDTIRDIASGSVWTNRDDLLSGISLFKDKYDELVPNLNDPVQNTGRRQSTYNQYYDRIRDLSSTMPETSLERLGLTLDYRGSILPQNFRSKSGNPIKECLDDFIRSFGIDEFYLYGNIFDLVNLFDFSKFLDLSDAISTYLNIGCNESTGLEFYGSLSSITSELPLDVNYQIDPIVIVEDVLNLEQEQKDNMNIVDSELSSYFDDMKRILS